jgi:vacuolar-type H+-ATPase subunit F/Vma7
MSDVIALGSRVFVRQLKLGGTRGRIADAATIAPTLTALLRDPAVGLIMLEGDLVDSLPEDLYRQAFYSRTPEVVALGQGWNEVLRRRIRRVMGADLLAPRNQT